MCQQPTSVDVHSGNRESPAIFHAAAPQKLPTVACGTSTRGGRIVWSSPSLSWFSYKAFSAKLSQYVPLPVPTISPARLPKLNNLRIIAFFSALFSQNSLFESAGFRVVALSSAASLKSRRVCVSLCVCVWVCVFSLGDGDSVVCAVRDTPEPVSVQGGRADARSGSVPDHGYCRVASGRSDLVLQAPEGASHHAPPHSRRLPSCRQCHPLLNRCGHQSAHRSAALPMLGDSSIDATGERERDRDEHLQVLQNVRGSSSTRNTTEVDDWSWNVGSTYDSNSLDQCKNDTQGALYGIFIWVLI